MSTGLYFSTYYIIYINQKLLKPISIFVHIVYWYHIGGWMAWSGMTKGCHSLRKFGNHCCRAKSFSIILFLINLMECVSVCWKLTLQVSRTATVSTVCTSCLEETLESLTVLSARHTQSAPNNASVRTKLGLCWVGWDAWLLWYEH